MSVIAVGTVIYDHEQVSALPGGTRVRELGGSDREFEVDSYGRLYYGVATTCRSIDLDMPVVVSYSVADLPVVPQRHLGELGALRMDDIRFDGETDGGLDLMVHLRATHIPTNTSVQVSGRNSLIQLKSAAISDLTKAVAKLSRRRARQ